MTRHRFIPAVIVLAAAIMAGLILLQEQETAARAREAIRMAHRYHLRNCAEHVRDYMGAVYALLRFVSLDKDVMALRQNSHAYVEKLFEHGLEHNHLTEVYIVERSFDGTRRPFMTFERGSEGMDASKVHNLEREQEEYRMQKQQLRAFEQAPSIGALLSPEVRLCAPVSDGSQSPGHVYSVAIRSGGDLVGLVAGMLRADTILDVLRRARGDYVAALVSEHGYLIMESTAPAEIRQWLSTETGLKHIAGAAEDVHEMRDIPGWVMLSRRAAIESGDKWWLAYFYTASQETDSNLFLGVAGHSVLAGSIFLAGLALAMFVKVLHRRVSEQALHLQQRKDLERQVQEASDREKLRAGEIIHEDLCQRLAGIEAVAKMLEKKMRAAAWPEGEVASELCGQVKETLHNARETADELRPISLLQHGFVAAIQKLAGNLKSRKNIDCRVEVGQFPEVLDPALGTHLYRIVQEAVNNVVQHANATTAFIRLAATPERVTLEVADNGRGFEVDEPSPSGMGLRIMRYRAELIGAELVISSGRTRGTVVTCSCRTDLLSPQHPGFSRPDTL